jgi:hypothetical protein
MDSIPPPPQLDTDNTTIATTMSHNRRITLSTLTLLTLISMVTVIIIEYRVSAAEEDDTTVLLKTVDAGTFLGVKVDLSNDESNVDPNSIPKSYFAFKGIPYAKAPLGPKLRWTEPLPTNILLINDKPKVATQFKPPCSQWDSVRGKPIGSQDCLHINVFTPFVPMGGGWFI